MALTYDADERTITIKTAPAPRRDYYFVREYGRGGRMRLISAIRLLKMHGIEVDETVVFPGPKLVRSNGDAMIVLELDRPI